MLVQKSGLEGTDTHDKHVFHSNVCLLTLDEYLSLWPVNVHIYTMYVRISIIAATTHHCSALQEQFLFQMPLISIFLFPNIWASDFDFELVILNFSPWQL